MNISARIGGLIYDLGLYTGGYSTVKFRVTVKLPDSHPAKLVSDKIADEAGDQTGGLVESCTHKDFR